MLLPSLNTDISVCLLILGPHSLDGTTKKKKIDPTGSGQANLRFPSTLTTGMGLWILTLKNQYQVQAETLERKKAVFLPNARLSDVGLMLVGLTVSAQR